MHIILRKTEPYRGNTDHYSRMSRVLGKQSFSPNFSVPPPVAKFDETLL